MRKILVALIVLFTVLVDAQDFKIGKLKTDQFDITSNFEAKTPAFFIKKERFSEFKLNDWEEGWYAQKIVHNIIKINTTNGLDYGTVTINLYKRSADEERVNNIEGYTYELVDGALKKTKLDKKSIFKTTLSERYDQVSFAMPNVKEGVIVEYSYEVFSPFWKIDDLIFQEDVPVISYKAEVKVPEIFEFNTYYQGKYRCTLEQENKRKSFNFSFRQQGAYGTKTQNTRIANMTITEAVYTYSKQNIPPLKEEIYTNNLENYRSSIIFELASAELSQGKKKRFATSWEEVVQTLNESDRFGKPLLKTNFLKEEGQRFRESYPNQKDRAYSIYEFVKNNIAWDGKYRSRVDRSLKKAFESKAGSSAEVNLLLVALLREAGLTSHPVLSATKNYKVPIFPTLEGFNHILAAVALNDRLTLLDATERFAKPGQLSENVHNWEGRLVRPDGSSQKINLFSKKHVQEQTLVNITFSEDTKARGVFKKRLLGDNEIAFRKKFSNKPMATQEAYFRDQYNLETLTDFSLKSDLDSNAEISYKFESQELLEVINDKWYIQPLLFLKENENPFKASTRETPIDFKFPFIERKIINIEVPKTHTLQEIPEPIKLLMTDNLGEYSLTISQNQNVIQVMSIFKLNRTLFPPSEYETIRSFYTQMLERQTTPLVLIKK